MHYNDSVGQQDGPEDLTGRHAAGWRFTATNRSVATRLASKSVATNNVRTKCEQRLLP